MKKFKENIKGLALGIILSAVTAYAVAETTINSKDVYYEDNSALGFNNVQDAIDGTCTKFSQKIDTFLDKVYPIGSIYISTTLSMVTQVKAALGGEWQAYGNGRTLLSSTGESEKTGGSTTTTLTTDNLPEHTHDISHTHTTNSASITDVSVSTPELTASITFHSAAVATNIHYVNGTMISHNNLNSSYRDGGTTISGYPSIGNIIIDASHTHTVTGTVPSLSTNSISTTTSGPVGKGTAINVQNPYITVYMYKRIA